MGNRASSLRNLRKARAVTDPRTAACGRGRIQYEVALQLAVSDWKPMVAAVVMDHVFWQLKYYGRKPTASHYQRVRRAFELFAVRSHRLTTRGRPWVWRPKDEILNYPGGPHEWWWKQTVGNALPHLVSAEINDLTRSGALWAGFHPCCTRKSKKSGSVANVQRRTVKNARVLLLNQFPE